MKLILSKKKTRFKQLISTKKWMYNKNGKLTEAYHPTYKTGQRLHWEQTCRYNFDAAGKWTNKITVENQKPLFITERKTQYTN